MENENLDSDPTEQKGRPQFLTVLCILTFIGSGLGVLGGLLSFAGVSALSTFSSAAGSSVIWSILGLVAAILCLLGAIQMWNLKKSGFLLYLAGSAISVIVSIISTVMITSQTSKFSDAIRNSGGQMNSSQEQVADAFAGAASGFVWVGTIFGILITTAFVIMYNANRKHLIH